MIAILLLVAMTGADSPIQPELAGEKWKAANRLCWSGTNEDGLAVSEIEVKVACISAGVLTARLLDAGYCLNPEEAEWKPCR